MPMCHGSGGLAAQHRFGARTSLSVIMLGAAKIGIGLFLGAAAMAWMKAFPVTILGVFLLVAGVGLLGASRIWKARPTLAVGLVMVAVHLATGMLVLGFTAGWIAHTVITRIAGSPGKMVHLSPIPRAANPHEETERNGTDRKSSWPHRLSVGRTET